MEPKPRRKENIKRNGNKESEGWGERVRERERERMNGRIFHKDYYYYW